MQKAAGEGGCAGGGAVAPRLSRSEPSGQPHAVAGRQEESGRKPGWERLSSEIVISAGFLGNSWKVPEMTFLT